MPDPHCSERPFGLGNASPPCGAWHPAPLGTSTGPLGPVTISVLPMRPDARGGPDRAAWLAERRAAVIAAYDAEAPDYNKHEYPSDMQREWVIRLLRRLPPNSTVLDAPCGTGKYFPLVAAAGHQVAGIDQSVGMLDQARARGIAVSLERISLQDLSYQQRFDAVLTIDALENVPPAEWPLVLANLHCAVPPSRCLYPT